MSTNDTEDAIYEVCDVCKGGGESSGPNYCWKCRGSHERKTIPEDIQDGITERWHGEREDDKINKNRNNEQ